MFTIKVDHELSEANYDRIVEWPRSIVLKGNILKENFYAANSMMKPLSLKYRKIDMCLNFCILYYIENAELTMRVIYRHSCYKPITSRGRALIAHRKLINFPITHKLKRLFMSPKTAEHMTWHQSYDVVDEVMMHPFNSEAWKQFNNVHL